MIIFKHYSDGTTYIDSDGEYHGYLPTRTDKLMSVHIKHDGFNIYVYEDAIAIHHKYVSMVYEHSFKIGRWRYDIQALTAYAHNEKKLLVHMDSLLRELVNQHTLDGCHVHDYNAIVLINNHSTDTNPF